MNKCVVPLCRLVIIYHFRTRLECSCLIVLLPVFNLEVVDTLEVLQPTPSDPHLQHDTARQNTTEIERTRGKRQTTEKLCTRSATISPLLSTTVFTVGRSCKTQLQTDRLEDRRTDLEVEGILELTDCGGGGEGGQQEQQGEGTHPLPGAAHSG